MQDGRITRQRLAERLRAALANLDTVLAMWEAGSAALGRADDLSDLDLMVIVADGTVEAAWRAAEQALAELAPVELRFEVPQPTWHGHWQAFYRLQGAGPYLLVDLAIMEESHPNRFLEPELHGTPVVYFDKQGLVRPAPADAAAMAARIGRRLPLLREPAELFHVFVDKELERAHAVDALHYYQSILLPRLVEALRIRYCPWRYNFGLRYLESDLPPRVHRQVRALCFVQSAQRLRAKKARALALLRETLEHLNTLDLQQWLEAHRPGRASD